MARDKYVRAECSRPAGKAYFCTVRTPVEAGAGSQGAGRTTRIGGASPVLPIVLAATFAGWSCALSAVATAMDARMKLAAITTARKSNTIVAVLHLAKRTAGLQKSSAGTPRDAYPRMGGGPKRRGTWSNQMARPGQPIPAQAPRKPALE